jgi:hypothetical protein
MVRYGCLEKQACARPYTPLYRHGARSSEPGFRAVISARNIPKSELGLTCKTFGKVLIPDDTNLRSI